jgi:hypothetical protein
MSSPWHGYTKVNKTQGIPTVCLIESSDPSDILMIWKAVWRQNCPFLFLTKPTRSTNFTHLFCHETLHVSDSSSVHHQEFIHCAFSNGVCHTGLYTAFEQDQDETAVPSWSCSSCSTMASRPTSLQGIDTTYTHTHDMLPHHWLI